MEGMSIRPAALSDRPGLRRAVIELQDYEGRLHPSRLPGDQIADAYLDWLQKRAAERSAVLIAEIDGVRRLRRRLDRGGESHLRDAGV
jgi:hypothetical protein